MKNYIVINGKQIELSQETVDNIVGSLEDESEYASFVNNPDKDFISSLDGVSGDVHGLAIGNVACHPKFSGRCLLLPAEFDWEILPNNRYSIWPNILVAKKKKSPVS